MIDYWKSTCLIMDHKPPSWRFIKLIVQTFIISIILAAPTLYLTRAGARATPVSVYLPEKNKKP